VSYYSKITTNIPDARAQILQAVLLNIPVFWEVTLFRLADSHHIPTDHSAFIFRAKQFQKSSTA
jgi:hypothetical protein